MLPDKQYFKIGEVAKIVGVKPSVLRYWETEFRSIRPEKTRSNQRLYSRAGVERLLQIKHLLYDQGFTIAGARRRLREGPPDDETTLAVARVAESATLRRALDRVRKEVQELLRLVDE